MSSSRLLKQRVSIIGAGVAGLITAHGLARAGFRHVRIFDAAPNFASSAPSLHAGGVVLAGNGARILNQYGLLSKIAPYAQLIDNVSVRTHLNHPIHSYSPSELTRANSGLISLDDLGTRSLFTPSSAVTSIGVHGRLLHEVLFQSLPSEVEVEWNARVRNITKTQEELEDPPVNLHFHKSGNDKDQPQGDESSATSNSAEDSTDPDARLLESDIVIGADGLHSSLRYLVPQMANHPSPLEGSYIRGIVRLDSEVRDAEGRSLQSRSNELVEVWGTGMKLAYYFIDTNTICWIATVHPSYAYPESVTNTFASFPVPIHALLSATDPTSIQVAPIEELEPCTTPFAGRLVLVGETAHAATQELWQNLAMDMEDGAMLSHLLATTSHEQAFKLYGEARYPRVNFIRNMAKQETSQATKKGRLMAALRDVASSMMPPQVVRENMQTMLSYNAIQESNSLVASADSSTTNASSSS